jgi:hypothetical protein
VAGSRRDRNQTNGFLQTWLPGADSASRARPLDGAHARLGSVKEPFDSARLAASPDGKTILVHRSATMSDLMLIENFR